MNIDALQAAAGDRLALLQTFVAIVDAGSLSAAAAQLGTTQPTISRRLQTLERALGLPLLQRSTHAMTLTVDGQRCLERARVLLADWAQFESDLRGDADEPEGLLRVHVPHAFGQQQLIVPLADYLRRYPRVTVEWVLRDGTPDFAAEGIDCAIQVGEVLVGDVVALPLSEVPRIVVAAPAVLAGRAPPVHARDLAALPWLALQTFYRHELRLHHRESHERCVLPLQPRLSTDNLFALREAALMGLGVCVCSAWVVRDDLAQGRLLQLAPDWEADPLPVHLVYPPARFQPARLRRFIELARASLPPLMGQSFARSAVPPG